ncbi:30S ribosomal protein S16 [Candidatus Woesebacteria bacterium]|jgi:small subunit ribosomal protein S16|nr:30S ribosomal protein S16 [Candidatus Woesebacteria bacterium]MBP9687536.1 30S ribosomal protein S16 [Candidatus Woesebacteria bacterium]
MVKIRLAKLGKRNDHFYRIVAIESQNKNQGEALEILGFYHPREKKQQIDKKALAAWVAKGAIVSDAVKVLLA